MFTLIVALIIIESLVLTSLVYTEHEFWGLSSLIVAGLCYKLIAGNEPFVAAWHGIVDNPARAILVTIGYLIVGVVWSFFKYYVYVKECKAAGFSKASIQSESNKGKAIGWMAYWPFSILAHVAGKGIYKLFSWLYDQVVGVYDNILNKVYGN